MKEITLKFGGHTIVFALTGPQEKGWSNANLVSSTLFTTPSLYLTDSHAQLIHSIIAQHANAGIDVESPEYIKGLEKGLTWYLFHEGR